MRTNAVSTAEYQKSRNNEYDVVSAPIFPYVQPNMTAAVDPAAIVMFYEELGKAMNWKKVRRGALRLFGRRHYEAAQARDRIQETLGIELPLEASQITELMNEVQRYKWLEAERAGRDIWRERDPRDPEAGALREWFSRHFGAWYLYHRNHRRIAA